MAFRWITGFGMMTLAVLLTACVSGGGHQASLEQVNKPRFEQSETVALGQLVAVAYSLFDADKESPNANPPFPLPFLAGYRPIANLQASDRKTNGVPEFYGHITESIMRPNELVISIRGTSDIGEWIDDAKVAPVNFSATEDTGHVEDGFKDVYSTFRVATPGSDETVDLDQYLSERNKLSKITVVGHSLGSSLATLVAFNAIHSGYAAEVELVTFASPRTGNKKFVSLFESKIPASVRFVNKPDIVPKVPPRFLGYRHIDHEVEVDSHGNDTIKRSIACYHSLQTYLHLIDPSIALAEECRARQEP